MLPAHPRLQIALEHGHGLAELAERLVAAGDVVEQRRTLGDAIGLAELAQGVVVAGLIVVGLPGEKVRLGALFLFGHGARRRRDGQHDRHHRDPPYDPHRPIFSRVGRRVKILG